MQPLSENALDHMVTRERERGAPPLTDWDSLSARLRAEGLIREPAMSRFVSKPWMKVAATTYPPSEIYYFKELDEKVETYGKPFKLVQDVTVLTTPEAKKALAGSPIKLSGRLEYQACDDKVCYAPTKIPISFDLTVK